MSNDFASLGLSEKVNQAVTASGYTIPTDIQAKAIPYVLEKKDVIGIAQTGTGKTASFVLPMLTLLEKGRARARMPRTLILEPTRELAAQVHENFEKYGANHRLTVALLIGGVSFEDQNRKLDRGADVLIATPGRLLDHIERGKLLLTGVEILVIDEADRMLDMGFIPDIERICGLLPKRRQTLFFSATMPAEIRRLTSQFLNNPVEIEVARQNSTAETITQGLVKVSSTPAEKRAALRKHITGAEGLTNAIIFCNRKRDVATLARSLQRHGFDASALHGDMDQKSRTDTLEKFRAGDLSLLIASDVAARGLDIPAVSHVFNFDVPVHAEDYIHRIGRTGRAGRSGVALTLVTGAETKHLTAIERLIERKIPWFESGRAEPRKSAVEPATEDASTSKDASSEDAAPKRTERKRSRKPRTADSPVPVQAQTETRPEKTPSETPSSGATRSKQAQIDPAKTPFGNDGPIPAFLLRPPVKVG